MLSKGSNAADKEDASTNLKLNAIATLLEQQNKLQTEKLTELNEKEPNSGQPLL